MKRMLQSSVNTLVRGDKMGIKCHCGEELTIDTNYECQVCKEMNEMFDAYNRSMKNTCTNDSSALWRTNSNYEEKETVIEGDSIEIAPSVPDMWLE